MALGSSTVTTDEVGRREGTGDRLVLREAAGRALDGWADPEPPLCYDPERDPYRVYLDRLDSEASRRTMRGCLARIARIITKVETGTVTGAGRPWGRLRYEHTARIRAELRGRTGEHGGPDNAPVLL